MIGATRSACDREWRTKAAKDLTHADFIAEAQYRVGRIGSALEANRDQQSRERAVLKILLDWWTRELAALTGATVTVH